MNIIINDQEENISMILRKMPIMRSETALNIKRFT